MPKPLLDRTGEKYGPWIAVGLVRSERICGKMTSLWLCRCECGNEKEILAKYLNHPPVCSCLINKKSKPVKHGKCGSRAYNSWSEMKARCLNKNFVKYEYYGGRGIKICDRWLKFENFYEDMGDPPEGMSLDRKDNNKGYFKDNCRWATDYQQANNTRNNRLITFNGKTQTLAEWSRETGLQKKRIAHRLNVGWPIEDIFIKDDMTGSRKYSRMK